MSIFINKDIDRIFINFCDLMDDFITIKQLNKYYERLIGNHFLFGSWKELVLFNKNNNNIKFSIQTNESLFVNACRTNNLLCKYLIKKFTNINIHANNELAFKLSCFYGHLNVAQWLIDLSKQSEFSLIDIHTFNEEAFRSSCYNGHLNVAHWLVSLSNKYRILNSTDNKIEYQIID